MHTIPDLRTTKFSPEQAERILDSLSPAKMAYVELSSVIQYDDHRDSEEWAFIIKHHSYKHRPSSPMEYMFNVEMALSITVEGSEEEQPPESLKLIFAKAFAEGYHYILFHEGC